jgi:hypothetical protein
LAAVQAIAGQAPAQSGIAPLSGGRLAAAHAGWAVVTLLIVGLDLLSIPLTYRYFSTPCFGAGCDQSQLTAARLHELQQFGLSAGFHAGYATGLMVFGAFAYIAIGILIFLRQSRDRMALFASITLIVFGGATWTDLTQGLARSTPVLAPLIDALSHTGHVAFFTLFCIFPDGRFVPRWSRWAALAWASMLLLALVGIPQLAPLATFVLSGPGFVGFILALIVAQIYRYRRASTPRQQRQTKWVVFGLAIGLGGFVTVLVLGDTLPFIDQESEITQLIIQTSVYAFLTLIPATIGVAILRSHLYEIDTLINRALVYGGLTAVVALVYFGTVLLLQGAVSGVTGQTHSDLVIVASTLGVAALFQPLRRRFQAGIDRRFYRRKYDAAQTLESFSATLRGEVDLDSLTNRLTDVVSETMQPTQIALWLLPTPAASQGRALAAPWRSPD